MTATAVTVVTATTAGRNVPLKPGDQVGDQDDCRWLVVRHIADGGFSSVYEAQPATPATRERHGSATRALKCLWGTPAELTAIGGEAAKMAAVEGHQNVLGLVTSFRFGLATQPYAHYVGLVLELAAEDLPRFAARVRPSERAWAGVFEQVAGGLEHIHGRRVVHGDIKPTNVLRVDGRFAVADFGVSAPLESTRSAGIGLARTIAFWPPESASQGVLGPDGVRLPPAEGWRATQQGDVWALAVSMHRLLTGRHITPGTTPEHQYELVCLGKYSLDDRLGPGWRRLLADCFVHEPAHRVVSTAAELRGRLAELALDDQYAGVPWPDGQPRVVAVLDLGRPGLPAGPTDPASPVPADPPAEAKTTADNRSDPAYPAPADPPAEAKTTAEQPGLPGAATPPAPAVSDPRASVEPSADQDPEPRGDVRRDEALRATTPGADAGPAAAAPSAEANPPADIRSAAASPHDATSSTHPWRPVAGGPSTVHAAEPNSPADIRSAAASPHDAASSTDPGPPDAGGRGTAHPAEPNPPADIRSAAASPHDATSSTNPGRPVAGGPGTVPAAEPRADSNPHADSDAPAGSPSADREPSAAGQPAPARVTTEMPVPAPRGGSDTPDQVLVLYQTAEGGRVRGAVLPAGGLLLSAARHLTEVAVPALAQQVRDSQRAVLRLVDEQERSRTGRGTARPATDDSGPSTTIVDPDDMELTRELSVAVAGVTRQRDELAQDRDRLVRHRDELTAERDRLRQQYADLARRLDRLEADRVARERTLTDSPTAVLHAVGRSTAPQARVRAPIHSGPPSRSAAQTRSAQARPSPPARPPRVVPAARRRRHPVARIVFVLFVLLVLAASLGVVGAGLATHRDPVSVVHDVARTVLGRTS